MSTLDHKLSQLIDLASDRQIQQLCQPLNLFGISYFLYIKKFKNGQLSFMTTHGDWERYFYENNLGSEDYFRFDADHYQNGIYLWSTINCANIYKLAHNFGIGTGFSWVEKSKYYIEYWHFGASIDSPPTVLNNVLNNLDLIKRFMGYLKSNSQGIFNKISKKIQDEQLLITEPLQQPKLLESKPSIIETRDQFLNMVDTERYHITINGQENHLTKKEMICLDYLKRGLTAAEIAEHLFVSKRTIETHIDNIKAKIDCNKQFQLGYLLARAGVI